MAPLPNPHPELELPSIHLRIHPLDHPGATHFLEQFGAQCFKTLASHCRVIIGTLYPSPSHPSFPTIHSITLFIRPMGGVAYTTEGLVDPKTREIHFAAGYIERSSQEEISGVLIHELVHVWQRNGDGSAPGGFIEGLADYIRLKVGLGAKHWKKSKPEEDQKWDAGYERTAWFLEWVEERSNTGKGKGWLQRVNVRLAREKWGDWVWEEAGAKNVDELWRGYISSFGSEELTFGEGPPPAVPTHEQRM